MADRQKEHRLARAESAAVLSLAESLRTPDSGGTLMAELQTDYSGVGRFWNHF